MTVPFSVLPLASPPLSHDRSISKLSYTGRPVTRVRLIACRGELTTIHHHRAGRSPLPGSPTRPKAEGTIGTTVSVATGSARIMEAPTNPTRATTTTPPCLPGWLAGTVPLIAADMIGRAAEKKSGTPRAHAGTRRLLGSSQHGRVGLAPSGRAYGCLDQEPR